jgi:hypothetical protein
MESIMKHPARYTSSFSSFTNGARVRRNVSRLGAATLGAFALAVCAFISTGPAAAATSERAVYCLSGESENDCGFASLAQCEATASGGLGVCDMAPTWTRARDAYAMQRSPARSSGMHNR